MKNGKKLVALILALALILGLNAPALARESIWPSPEWKVKGILELPWNVYRNTGDESVLSNSYESMKKYIDFEIGGASKEVTDALIGTQLTKSLPENIYFSYWGDHLPPDDLATGSVSRYRTITATAYVYKGCTMLSEIATILGKAEDATKYATAAEEIKAAFNEWFYDESVGYYHSGKLVGYIKTDITQGPTADFGQTPQIVALAFGLVTDENRETVLNSLAKNMTYIGTGLVGTTYMYEVLTENGYIDQLYSLVTGREYPSYGYWIDNGATTLWEYWETGERSQNHASLGAFDEWFYRYLAGIREDSAGYKTSIIKPYVPTEMTSISAETETKFGTISSAWEKTATCIKLDVVIPQNTTSTVYVPLLSETAQVTASDSAVRIGTEDGYAIYRVSAGNYSFTAE